ncbi:phosphodiester glycosidase family protein [Sinomonas halotolerans]|uniref:Phosphodiester glycosidase family protein n=1 Tax=Sinomonas halotolerans TaxID=1644133 RepID=A0ABU9X1W2_9MICC
MIAPTSNFSRLYAACAAVAAAAALTAPAAFAEPAPAPAPSSSSPSAAPSSSATPDPTAQAGRLALGAEDLPETRTVTQLAPGVTRTSITRGAPSASLFWTAEVAVPSDSPDPDAPASAISSREGAERTAERLRAAGVDARVEHVVSPQLADAGGELGYRVRAGNVATKAEGAGLVAQIKAAGYASSLVYTGWDGDSASGDNSHGQWKLEVLTIDPKEYTGQLAASFGPDLQGRESVTALAQAQGALAGVNGGFFVFDPKAGAEGDPAGVGVYGGRTLSEPVGDRPALVVDGKHSRTSVERLRWRGTVRAGSEQLVLDGVDRVPGLVRNCGGTGDTPTWLPLHDVTCTDADELVAFTSDFGPQTPAGAGVEVVLDASGRVTEVRGQRGMAVPAGARTLQATGSAAVQLREIAPVGRQLQVTTGLVGEDGKALDAGKSTSVVNGGPLLIQDGAENVTAARDGMVHPGKPSFFYGWVHKRNPRTFAGVDAQGRTLLVTADGRQTDRLGLSIKETAQVAASLGMVQAINLDGGGSTAMSVGGSLVTSPSGGTERTVGDALLLLPGRETAG